MPEMRRRRRSTSAAETPGGSEPPPPPQPRRSSRRTRLRLLEFIKSAVSLKRLRWAVVCAVGLATISLGVYGARKLQQGYGARTLTVCVLSDYPFRDQMPDWETRLKLWFGELNREFQAAGVQWVPQIAGDAYSERFVGTLEARRRNIEETSSCAADVVLGLSGRPDPDTNASVAPFGHAVMVATAPGDSDAVAITRLARTFAQLFGAPGNTNALITTDSAPNAVLDAASLRIVQELRAYDFARGVSGFTERWEKKVAKAYIAAETGKAANPSLEAHRMVARTLAAASKRAEAIAQFREALQAAPSDSSLHFELALELNADALLEDATAEFREAARLDPDDARPHAALAIILLNRRMQAEAIDELRTAARIDPLNPGYQSFLGQVLAGVAGGAQEASTAFRAALHSRPNDQTALLGSAKLAGATEGMRTEVARREEDVRKEPGSSAAQFRLGVALAQAGQTQAAMAAFRKSADLDPKNGAAHLAMSQLNFVAGNFSAADAELTVAQNAGMRARPSFVESVKRKLAAK
jgi:Flp pilus assembly protein TadD